MSAKLPLGSPERPPISSHKRYDFATHYFVLATLFLCAAWFIFLINWKIGFRFSGLPGPVTFVSACSLSYVIFVIFKKSFGIIGAFSIAGLLLYAVATGLSATINPVSSALTMSVRNHLGPPIIGFLAMAGSARLTIGLKYQFPDDQTTRWSPSMLTAAVIVVFFLEAVRSSLVLRQLPQPSWLEPTAAISLLFIAISVAFELFQTVNDREPASNRFLKSSNSYSNREMPS